MKNILKKSTIATFWIIFQAALFLSTFVLHEHEILKQRYMLMGPYGVLLVTCISMIIASKKRCVEVISISVILTVLLLIIFIVLVQVVDWPIKENEIKLMFLYPIISSLISLAITISVITYRISRKEKSIIQGSRVCS